MQATKHSGWIKQAGDGLIQQLWVQEAVSVLHSLICYQGYLCTFFSDTVMQRVSVVPGSQESSTFLLLAMLIY